MALASHHMPFGPAGAAHGASVPNLVRTETKRLEDLKMRPPLEKERVSGQLSSNLALERLCGRARGPVSSAVFAGIFRCVRRGAPRTKVDPRARLSRLYRTIVMIENRLNLTKKPLFLYSYIAMHSREESSFIA